MNLYLLINLLTLAGPLAWSFEGRISLFRKWYALLPAILITAVVFIAWDARFTAMGVWGFNPDYAGAFRLWGLPLGEILFFITVPYASVFIYEIVKTFWAEKLPLRFSLWVALPLIALGLVLLAQNPDGWYTLLSVSVCFYWLLMLVFMFRPKWLNTFMLAYLLHLVPFLIVNGVLTALPVVWYNDLENSGIRLGSIPLEDLFYAFSLFVMNVSLYEFFRKKFGGKV